jgi:hypothetical protein
MVQVLLHGRNFEAMSTETEIDTDANVLLHRRSRCTGENTWRSATNEAT